MTKPAPAVALLALLGTAIVASPAVAAELPAIQRSSVSIPDEAGADTISQLQAVTITDLAPSAVSVQVTLAGEVLQPLTVVEDPVGVFTATGAIDTWGFAGNNRSLVLAQCVDSAATDCGDPLTISTQIDNPGPTHDLNPAGTEFSEPFDLTPHLAATSGTPRLRITTDAGTPALVDPETVTPVDTDALSEGAHQTSIAVCAADASPCTAGETVDFTVIRGVQGTLAVSATAFSPNGAGVPDTIDLDYARLSDPWTSAKVEVRAAGTTPVLFQSAVPVPGAPDSGLSVTYDGRDGAGAFLPDGAYQARLVVTRTLDSGDVAQSTYNQPFTVDNTARAPATLTPSVTTFYPYADGYRDVVKLAYTGREPYSRVDFVVRNAGGDVVRTKQVLAPADASWNGRNDAGARVPDGTYSLRIRVLDTLGNLGFSPKATVTVSSKRLVTVTKAVTVTPKASRVDGKTGACSTRRTPSLHGWAGSTGYLSNTRCRTTFDASIVWTLNRVKLAPAVTYRWVRLGWYGGPTRAATHDRAIATLYGTGGDQGWYSSLDFMAAQYIPSVSGSRVVKSGYVSWGFQTDRGNRYDVKSFTITYRVDVLR